MPDNSAVVVEANSMIMMKYNKVCVFVLLCLISISTSLSALQSELETTEPGTLPNVPVDGTELANEENLNEKKEEPVDILQPPIPDLDLESTTDILSVTDEDENAELEQENGVSSEDDNGNGQKDNELEPGEENEETGKGKEEIDEKGEDANKGDGKEKEEVGEENEGDKPESQKPVEVILEVNKPSSSFFGNIFSWPPSFPSFQFPTFSWPSFFGKGTHLLRLDP